MSDLQEGLRKILELGVTIGELRQRATDLEQANAQLLSENKFLREQVLLQKRAAPPPASLRAEDK